MLRACLNKRIPFQTHQKNFAKSIFTLTKNYFSSSILDEGEYIDGDLNFEVQSSSNQSATNEKDFQKKFVTFENFNQDLTRQAPKPNRIFKADIPNSIKSLSGKFNFQLDEHDEFNQELRNRQKFKAISETDYPKLTSAPLDSKDIKSVLDKIQKRIPAPDVEKNLTRIDSSRKTVEAQNNDPLKLYTNSILAEVDARADQTGSNIEEYIKGEEGVDYIDSGDNIAKTYVNFHSELIRTIYEMRDAYPRGSVNRNRLYEWRVKQEIEGRRMESLDDIKLYPGSSRGPKPEDDPDFFCDWLFVNMPDTAKRVYNSYLQKRQSKRVKVGSSETQTLSIKHLIHSDVPSSEMGFSAPEKNFLLQANAETSLSSHIDVENGEIMPFPDNLFTDYQAAQDSIEKWAIFRLYPILNRWTSSVQNALKDLDNETEEGIPPGPPSLFRYYNLLPEVARKSPIIINLVRCLEFSKHDMTLEQKEWALNYACEFTLPMDPILVNICNEAVISQPYFAPLWEELVIMEDQESEKDTSSMDTSGLPGGVKKRSTFDIDSAEISKLTQQGRPEHLKDVGNWVTPPRRDPDVPEEDPFPVLPLDYYDNDDGFWDDYIAWKEQGWAKTPIIRARPKFKH